ncbi:alpha/beta hydrolase [Halalkalibacter flavus]|uniref:alpha/beta hydrolase n=1 Tax=Halalkalibacter flavus TaxID=3090668 RepID=UPI002FC8143B
MEILSPRIKEISNNINDKIINDFWEEISQKGSPLIEDINLQGKKLVTFLYKEVEPVNNVVVILGPAGLDYARNKMAQLPSTNIWFRSYLISEDAKFQYLISLNDPLTYPIDILPDYKKAAEREAGFIIDPLNKFPYPQNNPVVSTVGINDANLEFRNKPLKGKYEEFSIWSDSIKNERKVSLYIPQSINVDNEVSILTVLDGELNPDYVPVLNLIDQLIEVKQIKPIVVTLVGNVDKRDKEMGCNLKFSNFLSDELTSYLTEKKKLNINDDNCLCGFSLAGIGALFTSINRSEIYKNVLMVSTPLYWSPENFNETEYLSWYIANTQPTASNIYIECGSMENHSEYQRFFGGTSNLLTNRHFRNVLIAKGYKHNYYEYNGGHDFIQWTDSLKRGLLYFYGYNNK